MDDFAKFLRAHETPTEKKLWLFLRGRRLEGLKFRRQQPIGKYIVDFYCAEKKLVVEIDGAVHYQPGTPEKDQVRQAFLESQGLQVLRFTTVEVENQLSELLERILQAVV